MMMLRRDRCRGVAGGVLPPFWAELLPLLAAYWGIRKSWLLCR